MALPASDNFEGSDFDDLTTYSSNWTYVSGGGAIRIEDGDANAHYTGGDAEACAYWNADTFADDQYAEITVGNDSPTGELIGPAVRASSSTDDYYGYYGRRNKTFLFVMDTGSWSQLGSGDGNGISGPEVARLSIEGTTLDPTIDSVTDTNIGTAVDSTHSSGSAGICTWNLGTTTSAEAWAADDIGGGAQNVTGGLAVGNGATTLDATTTVGSVTHEGGLAIANGALTLDGVAAPGSLTLVGSLAIADTLALSGSPVPGSVTLSSTIAIASQAGLNGSPLPGSITVEGALAIANGLGLAGDPLPGSVTHEGTLAIGNGAITLDATALAVVNVIGSLAIANGATTLDGTRTVGAVTVEGALAIANGAISLDGIPAPGSVTVEGALAIGNGATTLDGLALQDEQTATGTLAIANGLALDGVGVIDDQTVTGGLAIANGLALDATALAVVSVDGTLAIANGITTLDATSTVGAVTVEGGIALGNGITSADGTAAPGPVTHAGGLAIANGQALDGVGLQLTQNGTGTLATANGQALDGSPIFPQDVTGSLATANGDTSLDGTHTDTPEQSATGDIAIGNGQALDGLAFEGVVVIQETMDNLISNGTFDSDLSSWADGSNSGGSVTWDASGRAKFEATTGQYAEISQTHPLLSKGKWLTVYFNHDIESGVGLLAAAGWNGNTEPFSSPSPTATGDVSHTLILNGNSGMLFKRLGNTIAYLDNVEVYVGTRGRAQALDGVVVPGAVTITGDIATANGEPLAATTTVGSVTHVGDVAIANASMDTDGLPVTLYIGEVVLSILNETELIVETISETELAVSIFNEHDLIVGIEMD